MTCSYRQDIPVGLPFRLSRLSSEVSIKLPPPDFGQGIAADCLARKGLTHTQYCPTCCRTVELARVFHILSCAADLIAASLRRRRYSGDG
jgi:hypothetical protein